MDKFEVGEEVIIAMPWHGYAKGTVEHITKTGRYRVSMRGGYKQYFYSSGLGVGGERFEKKYMRKKTPEMMNKYLAYKANGYLRNLGTKLDRISDELKIKIVKMVDKEIKKEKINE